MGDMADYFIDCMQDETFAVRCRFVNHPYLEDAYYYPTEKGYWTCGDETVLAIKHMTDEHLGATIGWCLKYFPEESKARVAELRAEQLRRDFGPTEEDTEPCISTP